MSGQEKQINSTIDTIRDCLECLARALARFDYAAAIRELARAETWLSTLRALLEAA